MPLAGTFDVLDFGEVLNLLSRREATGRLQVRATSMHGTIWLAEGRATTADIGMTVGGESRNKSRTLIEEICFDALRSPRGSFEFHPEDAAVVPAGLRIRLETVVAAGRKRLEAWREVESVIHSFEAVPRLAEALGEDSVTVSQDRWRVLIAIDGRKTVAALAKRLDMELLDFCQLLKPLVESGAVTLQQPESWLKSLPKVRLDPSDRDSPEGSADDRPSRNGWPGGAPPAGGPVVSIDPALLIDAESDDATVNIVSTPVDSEGRPRPLAGSATAEADAAASSAAGRRRLRRTRNRPAGAELS